MSPPLFAPRWSAPHPGIQDSWHEGHLPVLTLANKGKFEHSEAYATKVANDVANLLFSTLHENIRNQPRMFVPL